MARLAAKKARKAGTRVIYTAHGFHFYKGAPLKNWLLFYPVEKHLAKYTDTLITINDEDFERAKKKFEKRCHDIEYVPGVGVDEKKFNKKLTKKQYAALRKSLKLKDDDFVMISVGRLDTNKNQGLLIRVTSKLVKEDKRYHLLLVGPDENSGRFQKLVKKYKLEKNVHFLGTRSDIPELLHISDVAVSASKREGLPVNLIESVYAGLRIVATDCRGNRDIVKSSKGFLISKGDEEDFKNKIIDTRWGIDPYRKISRSALKYSFNEVKEKNYKIYNLHKPLVSIVIPVYNVEKYIDECLESIISQTYNNLEIIIVNDGSKDKSLSYIKKYKDKRIKLISQRNNGLSSARNTGTKHASGKYILYVDSDDFLTSPIAVERMVETISRSDSDILFFRYNYYFNNNNYKPSKKNVTKEFQDIRNEYKNMVKRDTLNISAWSKMIRLDLIKNNHINFEEGLLSEDIDFSLKLYDRASKIVATNDIFYNYRQKRRGSISSSIKHKNISSLIKIIDKWMSIEYSDTDYRNIYYNYLAYQYVILLAISNDNNTTNKQKQWINDNLHLLNYDLNFKVKLAKISVKFFGANSGIKILKSYNILKNRGVIKI